MPANNHRNKYPERRPGEITERNRGKDEFERTVCDLLRNGEKRVFTEDSIEDMHIRIYAKDSKYAGNPESVQRKHKLHVSAEW